MFKTQKELNDFGRSVAYNVAFSLVTLAMGLACLPLLALNHPALKSRIPHKWTGIALMLQEKILKLDYHVVRHGEVRQGQTIYAVKHQSAWETIALWHILDRPVFVLKKELLNIPVFGWYLAKADNIVIDRDSGQKAVGQIIEQAMHYLMQGRNIVIFPEGTRTEAGKKVRYKQGIANVYEALDPVIVPVALNSGVYWPRNSFIRKSGTVDVEIMHPVESGKSKQEFMQELQTVIETATAKLVESPKYPPEPDFY